LQNGQKVSKKKFVRCADGNTFNTQVNKRFLIGREDRKMLKIIPSSFPYHPLFFKKINFYYKMVIKGMRGGCVEDLMKIRQGDDEKRA
jgi:hypothetical protein